MLTSLRRSLGAKFCAGLFILLIALPFTAPFRAWDSGVPFGKPQSDVLKTSDDLSDSTALAAGVVCAAPVLARDFNPIRQADRRAMRPPVLQLVLRL
jgi:hypothetical protein